MAELLVQNMIAFYRQRGEGEKSVLCVHGAGGSSQHWMAVKPPPGWRVLALDLPGHGHSQGQARDSVTEYADWVIEFIQSSGERPVLAGHSMGGAIALSAALSRPDLLSGLVLIGTGARLGVSPSILEVSQAGDMKRLDEMLTDWAYGPLVGLEQIKEWHRQIGLPPALTYFFDFTACSRFDVRDRLTAITLPTLVVCGSADRLTPLKYSEYLASGIPNARMVEIPDAGHMVMLERPDLFNAAIAEFCLEI